MMRAVISFVILVLAGCASAPVTRMNPEDIDQCTEGRSLHLEIAEITANPERYHFVCVTVHGLTSGPNGDNIVTISATQKAAYQRDETVYWRNRGSRSIGVRAWDNVTELPAYRYAQITGILVDCRVVGRGLRAKEGAWRAADLVGGSEDEIIILPGGFCHFSADPHIRANEVHVLPEPPPPRLLPRDRASLIGNLVPAPANWKLRPYVEGAARRFLDTLRRQDFAAFAEPHVTFTGENWRSVSITSAAQLTEGPFAAFGRLMLTTHTPQILIVPWIWYYLPYRLDPRSSNYSSIVCYCLTDDCRQSWPIHIFDADNRPDRPYACLQIEQEFWGSQTGPLTEVTAIKIMPAARSGFPEPREDAP